MKTHLAYNLDTREVITSNCGGNSFKRLISHRTASEFKTDLMIGKTPNYRWLFAHGDDLCDCMTKLRARGVWG